jgi:hypothetical protein
MITIAFPGGQRVNTGPKSVEEAAVFLDRLLHSVSPQIGFQLPRGAAIG